MHRHGGLQLLPQIGVHDRSDVGVGDDRGIGRDVAKLVGDRSGGDGLEASCVVGDKPGAQSGGEHRGGSGHEVTGSFGHSSGPLGDYTRSGR